MRWAGVAMVAILVAGCADVDPEPVLGPVDDTLDSVDLTNETIDAVPGTPVLAPRANLTIGDGVTIHINGTGWGRLAIPAPGGSLPVKIMHEEWDDLTLFSDDGDDVYDDGYNHTFLLFGRPMDFSLDKSFVWERWGTPGWGIWPHSNAWDEWDHTTLSYPAGDTLHLVFASSVEGYSFKIGDGGRDVEWRLGEHPSMFLDWPEPTDAAVVDEAVVEVARERDWRAGLKDQPPSYLLARAYTRNDGAIEAGVEGEDLGWEASAGENELPLTPFPAYSVTGNSWSASTRGGVLEETASLDMFRTLQTSKVKVIEKSEYAGFVAIPLQ